MGLKSTSSRWIWGLGMGVGGLLLGLLLASLPLHIIPYARTHDVQHGQEPEDTSLLPHAPDDGLAPLPTRHRARQHFDLHLRDDSQPREDKTARDAHAKEHEHNQHAHDDHRQGLRLALDQDTPRSLLDAYRSGEAFDTVSRLEHLVWVSEWKNLAAIDSLHELYLEQDMLESAIRLLRTALEIHPGNTELMIKLAKTLQLNNEPDKALDIISAVLHADPLNMHALERYRILLQERTGETAYFLIWSEELLRQHLHNSDLYINLASAYRDDVQDEMAEEVYKEGLQNNPHDFELKRAFADFLVSEGKFTEAIDLYKQYIQANPDNPYGYVQLGHVYLQLDDHEHAYALYQKTLALAPEYTGEITQSLAGRGLTPDGLFAR